jgi:hypothetical protein
MAPDCAGKDLLLFCFVFIFMNGFAQKRRPKQNITTIHKKGEETNCWRESFLDTKQTNSKSLIFLEASASVEGRVDMEKAVPQGFWHYRHSWPLHFQKY